MGWASWAASAALSAASLASLRSLFALRRWLQRELGAQGARRLKAPGWHINMPILINSATGGLPVAPRGWVWLGLLGPPL